MTDRRAEDNSPGSEFRDLRDAQAPGTEERADPYEVLFDPWMQALGEAVFRSELAHRPAILCLMQPWSSHSVLAQRGFMELGARIMTELARLTDTEPNPLCTQLLNLPGTRRRA